MTIPSPRRRFQFRLRTLMIVVTLLAVPLGFAAHNVRIVSERVAMRERITALGGGGNRNGPGMWMWCLGWEEYQAEHVPLIRRLLGDRAQPYIFLPNETPDAEMWAIGKAFPEAAISKVPRGTITVGL